MTIYTKEFIEGVDQVLNSNTFLLEAIISYNDSKQATADMTVFAESGDIEKQIIKQDAERWGNYSVSQRKGKMVKPNPILNLTVLAEADALLYLRSMLTVEKTIGKFWSPYSKAMERSKADAILEAFIWELTLGQKWKFYTLNIDFCYAYGDKSSKVKILHYFEDEYSSNSASLIVREDNKAFLLLTNGRD